MSQERETPRVCEHGQLARSCEICELKRELAESQAEVKRERERRRQIDDEAFEYAEKLQEAEAERDAALKKADDADTDRLRAIGLYDSCAEDRAKLQARVLEVEQRCGDVMMKLANCEARSRELELEVKTLNEDFDAVEAEHAEHIAQAKFELSRLEADARRYRWLRVNNGADMEVIDDDGRPEFVTMGNAALDAAIDAATEREGGGR